MATLSELRTEIAKALKQSVNGINNGEIDQAINDAIQFYSLNRFDFNDGFSSITTVAGTEAYDLPTDLLGITHAQLFWGSNNFTDLIKREWSWFLANRRASGQLRATPSTYYALRGRQIYLHPVPSSAFRVDLYYVKQILPFPMTGDDDNSEWTNEGRVLIRSRALYDMYSTIEQQADYAGLADRRAREEFDRLALPNTYNLGRQDITPYMW